MKRKMNEMGSIFAWKGMSPPLPLGIDALPIGVPSGETFPSVIAKPNTKRSRREDGKRWENEDSNRSLVVGLNGIPAAKQPFFYKHHIQ